MEDKLRECISRSRGVWASKRIVICKAKDDCEHRLPDQDGRFCKLSPAIAEMERIQYPASLFIPREDIKVKTMIDEREQA